MQETIKRTRIQKSQKQHRKITSNLSLLTSKQNCCLITVTLINCRPIRTITLGKEI